MLLKRLSNRTMSFNKNKYNAKKTQGGFDSKQEETHYNELMLLEKAGKIKDLKRQVSVRLDVNGEHVCNYRADASYVTKGGERVLYESKGFETDTWRIKKKLVCALLKELPYDVFIVQYKYKREEWIA